NTVNLDITLESIISLPEGTSQPAGSGRGCCTPAFHSRQMNSWSRRLDGTRGGQVSSLHLDGSRMQPDRWRSQSSRRQKSEYSLRGCRYCVSPLLTLHWADANRDSGRTRGARSGPGHWGSDAADPPLNHV